MVADIARIGRTAVFSLLVSTVAVTGARAAGPAPDWSGAFAGIYGGFGVYNVGLDFAYGSDDLTFNGIGGDGAVYGFLGGYNFRLADRWVGGVEGDFGWGRLSSEITAGTPDLSSPTEVESFWVETDWAGSVRGKIGYLVAPETLFYVAGGATIAHARYGYYSTDPGDPIDDSIDETLYGMVFVGIGAETEFAPSWRLRYEYLMSFLQAVDVMDGLSATPLGGIGRVALIRDFGDTGGGKADFGHAPASWTGFYVGGSAGQAISISPLHSETFLFDGFGSDGWLAGPLAGYNLQIGSRFVVGVEADLSFSNIETFLGMGGDGYFARDYLNYSVRGRLGWLATPSTMFYGFAGYEHVDAEIGMRSGGATVDSEHTVNEGVQFGGGIEAWVSERWTLRAEYFATIFRDNTASMFGTDDSYFSGTNAGGRIGVAYHID